MDLIRRNSSLFLDLLMLLALSGISLFLIGSYFHYNYLTTYYQDWIVHAFRIQSLAKYGFLSWDSIWSNGISYWKLYQYIPHLCVLAFIAITGFSITKSMLVLTVLVYLFLRISTYIFLRLLKFPPLFCFIAVCSTFAVAQEWVGVKDFSIFIAASIMPISIALWIKALKNQKYIYIFASLSGISWMLHPVIGYTLLGMLIFYLPFSSPRLTREKIGIIAVIFLFSFLPFLVPYLTAGYLYMNPFFSTNQFLQQTIANRTMGLSYTYFFLFILSWMIILAKTSSMERWPRLLLLFATLYLILIGIGQAGYLPAFVNQLQISRGIFMIGLILPFVFVASLTTFLEHITSRFVKTVITIGVVLILTEAVTIASQFTGIPTKTLENPVATYFTHYEKNSKGSAYVDTIGDASYLTHHTVRFATSYNEHAEAHPLSQRFKKLLINNFSFTSVSKKTVVLLNKYANVMGIEYLFVPDFSPLTKSLLSDNEGELNFKNVKNVRTTEGTFVVLKNDNFVNYAYIGNSNDKKSAINLQSLKKPSLRVDSFGPWDNEVSKIDAMIKNKYIQPVPLSFDAPDRLTVDLSSVSDTTGKYIVIHQSYDQNWHVENNSTLSIQPTSLRFMYISLNKLNDKKLIFKNSWPVWYLPVQIIGYLTFILVTIFTIIHINRSRKS